MKHNLKILLLILTTIISLVPRLDVSASAGYSNYDRYFFYSSGQANNAYTNFLRWGYVTNYPADTPFTKTNILSQIPKLDCFYASCHGGQSSMYAGYNGSESISASEIDAVSLGFYKFVYLDACWTAYSNAMASAFNINDRDGQDHAYLGWTTVIQDSLSYSLFTSVIFQDLDAGDTLIESALNAQSYTGCSSWIWYGKSTMKVR